MMRVLLSVVLMLHNGAFSSGQPCFNGQCSPTLNLTNKIQTCQILNLTEFAQCSNVTKLILSHNNITEIRSYSQNWLLNLAKLDLSSNRLQHLPKDFLSQAVHLLELFLQHNDLQDLPDEFLINSAKLRLLSLEGNPLPSVPSSLFQASLKNLTVDCRCDITGSIVKISSQRCAANNISCTNPFFQCVSSSSERSYIKDFYDQHCQSTSLLALYICLPIIVVGILGGIAIFYFVKRRRVCTDFQNKEASSVPTPTRDQQRYITRNLGGICEACPQQVQTPSKEYENVFVGPLQTQPVGQYECLDKKKHHQGPKSRKPMPEDDYYMECDGNGGAQPIYCNTQSAFYNNAKSSNMEDDDVYIVPDK